ncbi:hypothetical protein EWB00_007907, partial [Schistosoma japonicum]
IHYCLDCDNYKEITIKSLMVESIEDYLDQTVESVNKTMTYWFVNSHDTRFFMESLHKGTPKYIHIGI